MMKFKNIINTRHIVNYFIENHLKEDSFAIDCTIGNGNDTLKLKKAVGVNGTIYGFDIQDIAIKNTKKLLLENNLFDNINLVQDGHENIDKYIEEEMADFIIYNLGYLPGGNKSIKTKSNSTKESLIKSLKILKSNGLLLITVYTGHQGGMEEKIVIEDLISSLEQKYYNVLKYDFINQSNYPPILYVIEKVGKKSK